MNTTRTYENHGRNSYPLRKNRERIWTRNENIADAIRMSTNIIIYFLFWMQFR